MKKRIGIVLTPINSSKHFGINNAYVYYFSKFGDVVLLNPLIDEVANIDLLVLPGGADVDPKRYNAEPGVLTNPPNLFHERFDTQVLPKYIEALKQGEIEGIFGICRGMQSLGVVFGNPLVQHHMFKSSAHNWRGQTVDKMIVGKDLFPINSIHHQGFFEINDAFEIVGISENEGNIEAMRHRDLNIFAVQYHPEELSKDTFTPDIIKDMLGLHDEEEKEEKILAKTFKIGF